MQRNMGQVQDLAETVNTQAAQIERLRSEIETMRRDGYYEPTGPEVETLRQALHQCGISTPGNEALGFEWIRYAKRVLAHQQKKWLANPEF